MTPLVLNEVLSQHFSTSALMFEAIEPKSKCAAQVSRVSLFQNKGEHGCVLFSNRPLDSSKRHKNQWQLLRR